MPRDFESGSVCGPQRDWLPGWRTEWRTGENRRRGDARRIRYKRWGGRTSDKDVPSITSREKHLDRNSGAPVHAPTSSMLFQYALARQARNVNAKVNVDDE